MVELTHFYDFSLNNILTNLETKLERAGADPAGKDTDNADRRIQVIIVVELLQKKRK